MEQCSSDYPHQIHSFFLTFALCPLKKFSNFYFSQVLCIHELKFSFFFAVFTRFLKVTGELHPDWEIFKSPIQYSMVKSLAKEYQKSKDQVTKALMRAGCGHWIEKPVEQDQFSLQRDPKISTLLSCLSSSYKSFQLSSYYSHSCWYFENSQYFLYFCVANISRCHRKISRRKTSSTCQIFLSILSYSLFKKLVQKLILHMSLLLVSIVSIEKKNKCVCNSRCNLSFSNFPAFLYL